MSDTFFLDVFNHLLKIGEKEVLIIFDKNGDIWFGFRDLVKVLEYDNFRKAMKSDAVNNKFKKTFYDFKGGPLQGPPFKKKYNPTQFLSMNLVYINYFLNQGNRLRSYL